MNFQIPLLLLSLLLLGNSSQAQTREPSDAVIENGLKYLQSMQQPDGSWLAGKMGKDPAVTALSVMAFLSAGHVPGEGKYAQVVEKGIRYVANLQQKNGLFAPVDRESLELYYHGICTLMLAEVIGMCPDAKEAKRYREKLESAVKVILTSQRTLGEDKGGWRYRIQDTDSDISVTGWQLMALRAARNVGCDVPGERIDQAMAYIQRCHDEPSGGYRYQVRRGTVTPACTGTAVLALELGGKAYHRSPEALRAAGYLLKHELNPNQIHFFYGVYYTSQAMFQLGDNYWKSYRPQLHALLLQSIAPRPNGSWQGRGNDDVAYGPNYCTAMAILSLTVEHRLLPIYQREEP